jgi:hypothetical protein
MNVFKKVAIMGVMSMVLAAAFGVVAPKNALAQVASPVITSIPQQSVVINTPLTFTASATNPNGGTIGFSLGLPTNATADQSNASIDSVTGAFTWTPTATGAFTFFVVVDDGIVPSVWSEVDVVVTDVGVTPTFPSAALYPIITPISQQTVSVGSAVNLQVVATNPNNGTLVYSDLTGSPTADQSSAAIDSATGAFTWTPTVTGTVTFFLGVDDGVFPISNWIPLTIVVTPPAPLAANPVPTQTIVLGNTDTFTVGTSGGTAPLNFSLDATAPATATIDPLTGAFSWVTDDLGTSTFNVIVTDSAATPASVSVPVTIDVIPVPVLTTVNVTPVNPSVTVGATQQFMAATLDQNGAAIAASTTWSSSNPSVATVSTSTGLATSLAVGTTTITATSGAVTGTTILTVKAVPVVPPPPTTKGGSSAHAVSSSGGGYARASASANVQNLDCPAGNLFYVNGAYSCATSGQGQGEGQVLGASAFSFTNFLREGISSDAVKQLQEKLRAEGFFTYITSTGHFGPMTLLAVKTFQAAHGIPATGFVGSLTIAELNK